MKWLLGFFGLYVSVALVTVSCGKVDNGNLDLAGDDVTGSTAETLRSSRYGGTLYDDAANFSERLAQLSSNDAEGRSALKGAADASREFAKSAGDLRDAIQSRSPEMIRTASRRAQLARDAVSTAGKRLDAAGFRTEAYNLSSYYLKKPLYLVIVEQRHPTSRAPSGTLKRAYLTGDVNAANFDGARMLAGAVAFTYVQAGRALRPNEDGSQVVPSYGDVAPAGCDKQLISIIVNPGPSLAVPAPSGPLQFQQIFSDVIDSQVTSAWRQNERLGFACGPGAGRTPLLRLRKDLATSTWFGAVLHLPFINSNVLATFTNAGFKVNQVLRTSSFAEETEPGVTQLPGLKGSGHVSDFRPLLFGPGS